MRQQIEITPKLEVGDIVKILNNYATKGRFGFIQRIVEGNYMAFPYVVESYSNESVEICTIAQFGAQEIRKTIRGDLEVGDKVLTKTKNEVNDKKRGVITFISTYDINSPISVALESGQVILLSLNEIIPLKTFSIGGSSYVYVPPAISKLEQEILDTIW